MTLEEIVSDYMHEYRNNARAEMRFFEISAVRRRRSTRPRFASCQAASVILISAEFRALSWNRSRQDFWEGGGRLPRIASAGEDEIGSINGIGALAVYDIAHRIGAYLGKFPMLVYV